MPLTYQEIAPFVEQGKNAAEIAALLNADFRHYRDAFITGGPSNTVSVNVLFLLTSKWGVLKQNSAQVWIGSLVDLANQNGQEVLKGALEQLFPYLQVNDAPVYCGVNQQAAGLVEFLIAVVGALVGDVDMVRADVAVLTGGRRYGSVTEQEVQSLMNQSVIEAARRAASQAGNVVWNQFMSAVEAWDGAGEAPTLVLDT